MKLLIAIFLICSHATVALSYDSQETESQPADTTTERAPDAKEDASDTPRPRALSVEVKVSHGISNAPVPESLVFLRASRPRGPFEPTAPPIAQEWTAITDSNGLARFDVPRDILEQGLRLHALTTWSGVPFESIAIIPSSGARIEIPVYEVSTNPEGIEISSLRTIIEPWEEYLVFTQMYAFTNTADVAIDTSMVTDAGYDRGLPIVLPVKAQGIQVMASGQHRVVNSTVYWGAVLQPGQRRTLQIRFSMSAKEPTFTYEQRMDFPVQKVEVVAPVQTQYQKVPRLENLTLVAPGFQEVQAGKGLLDLRDDMDFIAAWGQTLQAGEKLRFQLRGLPFKRPLAPWIVLALSFLVFIGILFFGRGEQERLNSGQSRQRMLKDLEAERERLFEELVTLEKVDRHEMTDREYERLSLSLRERLALIMKKIRDLEEGLAG